jgi:uncharacterized protein DUF6378
MSESTEIVNEVIDGRRGVYGEPTNTFARMAQMISGLLGFEVHAWQVPLILIITKMVRTNQCPTYSDNSDDIEGYLAIFRELVGDDMVHARSVDEYLEKLDAHRDYVAKIRELERTDVDG